MRRLAVGVFGVAAIALSAAGVAWACTADAYLGIESPSAGAGPPGTKIQLVGHQWHEGPVEIYWNSPQGPRLGTAEGPSFATIVTIPATAAPGVGYIYARAIDPGGSYVYAARTGFEVTAPSQSERTAGGDAPAAEQTTAVVKGSDVERNAARLPASTTKSLPASSQPPAVTTVSGGRVFGPSLDPQPAGATTGSKKAESRVGSEPSRSSDQIASGEPLFSGLKSPAVLPSPFDAALGSDPASNLLTIGVGLLGAGLVAMFAGILGAEVRKRRLAEAGRRAK